MRELKASKGFEQYIHDVSSPLCSSCHFSSEYQTWQTVCKMVLSIVLCAICTPFGECSLSLDTLFVQQTMGKNDGINITPHSRSLHVQLYFTFTYSITYREHFIRHNHLTQLSLKGCVTLQSGLERNEPHPHF